MPRADHPYRMIGPPQHRADRLRQSLNGRGRRLLHEDVAIGTMFESEKHKIDGIIERHHKARHVRISQRQCLARPHLLDENGRPNFDVVMYAVRKDGAYGSASMFGNRELAVCDARGARLERTAGLFER